MTNFLFRPYVCAIIAISVILFLAVDELEPNRVLAFILQCVILATGGGDCKSVDVVAALGSGDLYGFDQHRIVGVRLGAIDPLRYWPPLKEVVRHWL